MVAKRCSTCNVVKPAESFASNKMKDDGLQARCRLCCLRVRRIKDSGQRPVYWKDVLRALDLKCCSRCGETKARDDFSLANTAKGNRDSRYGWCAQCCRTKNLEYRFPNAGMTGEELDALVRSTRSCQICGDQLNGGRHLHIDHCHDTGRVRGVLCQWCNVALGNFRDDAERLRKGIAYLERTAA